VKPSFTADVDGSYVFSLVVNDGTVNSTADTVTITAASVTSVTVSPTDRSIPLGHTKQYIATATFADGSSTDVSTIANWSTSDSVIATVASSGLASSVSEGTVTVSATYFGITGSTSLTVTAVQIDSVVIQDGSGNNFSLQVLDGQTVQLHAIATYSDGTTGDVTESVSWSVPLFDAGIISVSDTPGTKGFVTTNGPGTGMVISDFGSSIFIEVQ